MTAMPSKFNSFLFWTLIWILYIGLSDSDYSIPIKIFAGQFNWTPDVDVSSLIKTNATKNGLSLASNPAGVVRFLDMVNNLQGDSGRGYYMEMLIGTPPQTLNILVDTGSSNFAVAAAPNSDITNYFIRMRSSTYHSSGKAVTVKYTQGAWEGELGTDWVSIPEGPSGNITVRIAAILSSDGFFLPGVNWQGILGLAYPILAQPDDTVEPFFDSLVRQTGIPDIFSLQMCGAGIAAGATGDPAAGSLIMGGVEQTLYKGSIWYTPIKEEWYYQVEILKLEVGNQNLNLDCKEYNSDKAIVDSGTTLLRLPKNVFVAVIDAIIQSSLIQDIPEGFWTDTKLACWRKGETPWRYFPKLSIYLRATNTSQSFRITILPQLYLQSIIDLYDTLDCFRFGISPSVNGLVIGATVMEGFYVIFDRIQKRVGFAVSTCAESNGLQLSEIAGPFAASAISSDCLGGPMVWEPLLWIISYSVMAVCTVVLLVLFLVMALPCHCRRGNRSAGLILSCCWNGSSGLDGRYEVSKSSG